MAIFSFKSKVKKAEEKKEGVAVESAESKPAEPYKHTPKHAAADSLGQGDNAQDAEKISMASKMRRHNSTPESTFADASRAQNAMQMAHGLPTPSSVNRRNSSNEAFTTHANDYFAPSVMRKLQANDPQLGYTKVALARQDQGLTQYASDSGYESAGPSRVPSEQNLDSMSRQYLTRPTMLHERRISDDGRSEKSIKSAMKKTRFQADAEPMPPVESISTRTLNLAALEGFKVNKKGKVLDEEGDVIGKLVDGDLLDCVRQKVDANGQVLDDAGKIVGNVRLVSAPLPSLIVPAAGQSSESSPTSAPRSPTFDLTGTSQSVQDPSRRIVRSASERSLSDLSKPYARPPMSSVPEDNVAGDDGPPMNPELFGYKGEIPAANQQIRGRSSSPPTVSAASGSLRPNPRRVSSGATSSKSFGRQPVGYASRRGPLISYDNSPVGSDDGTETSNSDDGRFPTMNNYMYKRPMSIRSSASVSNAQPRTYFTHAGRVTIDPNAPPMPVVKQTMAKPIEAVAPKEEKKKSRLSFLGKK